VAEQQRVRTRARNAPSMLPKVRNLLKGLSKDLAAAAAGAQVHGARRRIKRLRSLSRLVRPAIGKAAFKIVDDHLKTAADALAGPRRAEALDAALTGLGNELPRGHALEDLLKAHHTAHASEGRREESIAAARAALDASAIAVGSWKLPRDGGEFIAQAFAETYRKARKRLAAALRTGNVESLHDARKQVIHHLHHLELLADALPNDPKGRIAALDGLRRSLGDLNDLAELEALAEAHRQSLPKDVRKVLRARHQNLLRLSRKAWKPLFGIGTKAFVKRIGAMWSPAPD